MADPAKADALFRGIQLDDKVVATTLANKKVTKLLVEVIGEAGVEGGCDKAVGLLLYDVATTVRVNGLCARGTPSFSRLPPRPYQGSCACHLGPCSSCAAPAVPPVRPLAQASPPQIHHVSQDQGAATTVACMCRCSLATTVASPPLSPLLPTTEQAAA